MFICVNKKTALAACAVVVICVAALLLNFLFYTFSPARRESAAVMAESGGVKKVIVDAGHGGFDGGATADGIFEKQLNLLIATELEIELLLRGYDVIMTRDEDEALGGDGENTTKRQDMNYRKQLMDKNPDAIFVSIHMNKFSDRSCKGAQVFYGQKHSESENLAQFISESVKTALLPDNHRLPKRGGDNIYLLRTAGIPAVIVECGFISNAAELAKLCDPDYQTAMAKAIADGIDSFFYGGPEEENLELE